MPCELERGLFPISTDLFDDRGLGHGTVAHLDHPIALQDLERQVGQNILHRQLFVGVGFREVRWDGWASCGEDRGFMSHSVTKQQPPPTCMSLAVTI